MTIFLDARKICKDYGKIRVLKNVDLQVNQGATHAVIGPNGAGKTTLFRVLSGEIPCDTGQITYSDKDVTSRSAWQRVRMGVGRTFQVAQVFAEFSTLENLLVATEARTRNLAGRQLSLPFRSGRAALSRARDLLAEVGLADKSNIEAAHLSHGDKKRLELAMAMAMEPSLLMLDEPMAGMSPTDRQAAVALIARVKKARDMTLLITEHDMDVVFALATELTVLHQGEIAATGDPETVRRLPIVRELYLGKEDANA